MTLIVVCSLVGKLLILSCTVAVHTALAFWHMALHVIAQLLELSCRCLGQDLQ